MCSSCQHGGLRNIMRNFPGLRVQWLCHLGSVLIVSSLFSACGGRTRGLEDLGTGSGSSGQGDGDGDGDPGAGGSSTGGHVGTGGLFPSGGTFGTGGDSTVGTGGVQTGAECLLPAETGECDAAIPRYYYDAASESCKQFTWGGCGGNANNFETITECYDTCFDGDLGARQQCTIAADCTLIFKSCCEPCEGKTPDDYWAINK